MYAIVEVLILPFKSQGNRYAAPYDPKLKEVKFSILLVGFTRAPKKEGSKQVFQFFFYLGKKLFISDIFWE